jgi:hypothetical protein
MPWEYGWVFERTCLNAGASVADLARRLCACWYVMPKRGLGDGMQNV